MPDCILCLCCNYLTFLPEFFLGLKKNQNLALGINGGVITNSKEVVLLGVTIDLQLNFKGLVKELYV